MNKTHTQDEVASALGVSQSMVSKDMKAAGIPAAGGITLADVVALVQWRTRRDVGISGGIAYDYEAERARLTHEQADKTALENAELRADLVRMSVVESYWASLGAACRSKLVSIPSKLGTLVADATARVKLIGQAEALIYDALAEIQSDAVPHDIRARAARSRRDDVPAIVPPAAKADA